MWPRTTPAAPLPTLKSLVSALSTSACTGEKWLEGRREYVARIYQSGRVALAAGIEAVQKQAKGEKVTVWFPGYFCNDVLDPLRSLSIKLRFYPIREDLSPDWKVLNECFSGESSLHVFVLVHYFGFPNVTEEARAFCMQSNNTIILLEDASHVLFPYLSVGLGDVLVFSPRKLLAVPSGGILLTGGDLAMHLADGLANSRVEETVRWLTRRLAQMVLVRLHIPWHVFRRTRAENEQFDNNGLVDTKQRKCGPFSLRLLSVMEQQLDEVVEQRRQYYKRLLAWTSELVHAKPLIGVLPDGVCPYAFPMLLRDGSTGVAAKLQSWGIPAGQWPDMPPEVLADKENQGIAISTYEKLLLLPVHQSLSLRQIDAVGQSIRAVLSDSS